MTGVDSASVCSPSVCDWRQGGSEKYEDPGERRVGRYLPRRSKIEDAEGVDEGYWRKGREIGIRRWEHACERERRNRRSYRRWERDEYLTSPLQSRSQSVRGLIDYGQKMLTLVNDEDFTVERKGSLLDRLKACVY